MASTTDVRAWALEEGYDVKARGNLPKLVWEQYAQAHPDDEASAAGAVTEADYPAADGPGETGETRPRPPARPAGSGIRGRVAKLFAGPGKAGRKRARIPLDSFAENAWTDLAQVAPWPPLKMILGMQAAYAAAVFDDTVRGTFIDPLVQPVARADQTLRAVDGLLGPPLFTAAICAAHGVETDEAGRPRFGPDGWPVWDARTKIMFAGLKYSLIQMDKIANLQVEEIEEKAAQMNARAEKADRLIEVMFGMMRRPADQGGAGDGPVPEAAVQQMGNVSRETRPGFLYPVPPAMDDTGADPGRMP
jgi:hypothetical protein